MSGRDPTTGGTDAVAAGAAAYTPLLLRVYDTVVVRVSNTVLWRCPRAVMLQHYREHLGARHTDIGPGTGWYLDHADLDLRDLVLVDLNPNSLRSASTRLRHHHPTPVRGDVLEPLPAVVADMDSIAANYLLHCVPGDLSGIGPVFAGIGARLTPDGVFFGASILGSGGSPPAGVLARRVMRLYRHRGIFHNSGDTADGLAAALDEHFAVSAVRVVGSVPLFHAREPRGRTRSG